MVRLSGRYLNSWLLRIAEVKLRPTHCSHNLATLSCHCSQWGVGGLQPTPVYTEMVAPVAPLCQ